ncbi:uncharacterized protein Z520_05133 [Fonsecaea multimorphosa CBS 102226]|uniref:Enoyl reductase (ER) domain-containing protein n=1 Tax=Fonsecaea multimorphosa CBS 102226 TaxID=1442371 RepID=A0A0D2K172_9EURO|nr:uncharacterized protein Z520_05133 [Fonsecaea multimorphosa CBS 102226]KIX99557.1 hypothetical protein Z520_05133 [Fonsecaea multimorphosa CBS 102226]OAL25548.1 hypothetical protein AYO22_04867 [Fonsecaea multimorphosa]
MATETLPKTMLAWQKHLPSTTPVRVEVPVPTPEGDEILVQVLAAGLCHSDYSMKEAKALPPEFLNKKSKFTYGHEGCGKIVALGPDVKKFQVGDVVAMMCVPGCGKSTCHQCSHGASQICMQGLRYGGGDDGFNAAYTKVREIAAVKVPEGVDPAAGAVATDACMTAYHTVVGRAAVKKDETVLIFGLGGLGFNALQVVLHIGARAVVVDQRQAVLDEALKLGVKPEDIVPAGTTDVPGWVKDHNISIDKVIDFVVVPDTFKAGILSVRLSGTVVLVGLLSPEVPLTSPIVVRRELNILGSYAGTIQDVEACLDLIKRKVIVPQVVKGSLKHFPTLLEDLHHGKIKGRVAMIPEGLESH